MISMKTDLIWYTFQNYWRLEPKFPLSFVQTLLNTYIYMKTDNEFYSNNLFGFIWFHFGIAQNLWEKIFLFYLGYPGISFP